ncbi:RDD domain-containing protein [Moraxella macacae 0408225]|uniref:RDD domain-containing protein n=1 Tax=Moraxella macacae 0408225 TaxID=1230338 RepID=L2FBA4_9GAMM|nr:RDD family protein [Moraxella macacae]ELA09718.1 RDD domain-containing protein [Moraxella macacae 0408225]
MNSPKSTQSTKPIYSPKISDEQPVIAKPALRLLAMLYDGMLILALLFFVSMLLVVLGTHLFLPVGTTSQQATELPSWYQNFVLTPSFVLTLIGFYGVFLRKSGQTLGMQTWRLKTLNRDGSLLRWKQTVKRILAACLLPALCAILGSWLHGSRQAVLFSAFMGFLFNYWFAWVNKQGVAVHDMLSDTVTMKMPKIEHEGLFASFRKQ